jgi:hypothetical protein
MVAEKKLMPIGIIAYLFLFTGCNFTSQSYNHGKLLNPGETLTSIGVGAREYYKIEQKDAPTSISNKTDTVKYQWLSLCLDYRLGVLRKYPFGKGMEIGFHLEGPTQYATTKYGSLYLGPPILEFDGRLGFNDFVLGKGLFHHNMALGWTIGAWIDNGWYAEYAAGWEYKWLIPYANFRAELLATDPSTADSLTESYTPFKYQNRSWTTRTALGVSIRIPQMRFLPDYISPEISTIYPHYSSVSHYGITYHVGLRWLNGI